MLKNYLLLFLSALFISKASAQISGTVKENGTGIPIPGVTVQEKGTSHSILTDKDGRYRINGLKTTSVLLFSSVGFEKVERAVGSQKIIDVEMTASVVGLSEVVVVGYGSQKKVDLTGSVASVRFDDKIMSQPSTTPATLLQGRLSGVQITANDGAPGSEDISIRIRGEGSINTGSADKNGPMILVDGMQVDNLNYLNSADIASVSVLKDAASAAIYGSRAANGVILITTKNPKKGAVQVNYSGYSAWQTPTMLPRLLDSWDFATLVNESMVNSGQTLIYSDAMIQAMKTGSDPYNFANTYWPDYLYHRAFTSRHSLSVNGGSDKIRSLFSFGFEDQDGLAFGSGARKYNARLKTDANLTSWWTAGANISAQKKNVDDLNQATYELNRMIYKSPTFPVYTKDGGFNGGDGSAFPDDIHHVIPEARFGDHDRNIQDVDFQAFSRFEFLKNFSFKSTLSYKSINSLTSSFSSRWKVYNPEGAVVFSNDNISGTNSHYLETNLQLENVLSFNKKIGKHSVEALLGYSEQQYRIDEFSGSKNKFLNEQIRELNGGSEMASITGYADVWSLRSYFGRANYSYNDKYLLQATLRYDGSSRFSPSNRWAAFPSLAAGWRISNEEFMKPLTWLDNLKLRVSWGKLGNQEIGLYSYSALINVNNGSEYPFGTGLSGGAAVLDVPNDRIKWETTATTNVGLDVDVFKRISLTFDVFNKKTHDILLQIPIPSTVGSATPPYQNVGKVSNKGWELGLSYHNTSNELTYDIGANLSYLKNEILDMGGLTRVTLDGNTVAIVGSAVGSLYGYQCDGIFQSQPEIDAAPYHNGSETKPGDLRYRDISGADGVPDGKIDDADRTIIGTTIPKYSLGLNGTLSYKGFTFSFLLQGDLDYKIYNNGSTMPTGDHTGENYSNWTENWLGRSTPQNPNNNLPNLRYGYSFNQLSSSFWADDGSYLRLKMAQLSYNLSNLKSTPFAKLSSCQLFVSGQNLLTFSKMKDWDPERGKSSTGLFNYPVSRTIALGLNVAF